MVVGKVWPERKQLNDFKARRTCIQSRRPLYVHTLGTYSELTSTVSFCRCSGVYSYKDKLHATQCALHRVPPQRAEADTWNNVIQRRSSQHGIQDTLLLASCCRLLVVVLPPVRRSKYEPFVSNLKKKNIQRNRWFLESLLERSRPDGPVYWLRQITLECVDNMARHTATRLIAHACCCGANDPEESAILIGVDRASGMALDR